MVWLRCIVVHFICCERATIRRKKSSIQKRIFSLIGCLIDFYRWLNLRGISLDFSRDQCLFDLFWKTSDFQRLVEIIETLKKGNRWKTAQKICRLPMNETFMKNYRAVRAIDTSAEREIEIFHGPFITFFLFLDQWFIS